jgi:hypothetical protein
MMTKLMRAIEQTSDLQAIREALTDVMLSGAGLAIARPGETALDGCNCVTARQRALITKVAAYGYRVKLRTPA